MGRVGPGIGPVSPRRGLPETGNLAAGSNLDLRVQDSEYTNIHARFEAIRFFQEFYMLHIIDPTISPYIKRLCAA